MNKKMTWAIGGSVVGICALVTGAVVRFLHKTKKAQIEIESDIESDEEVLKTLDPLVEA